MKTVLDTNVLISGVIATGPPHEILLRGYRGEYEIVVSPETLAEFRETLGKYPDRFHMTDEEIRKEVETLGYFAESVDPDGEIKAVERDPDDDKFLAATVAGDADYVVSGDTHLLDLGSFREVDIVDPRTFLDELE